MCVCVELCVCVYGVELCVSVRVCVCTVGSPKHNVEVARTQGSRAAPEFMSSPEGMSSDHTVMPANRIRVS